MAGVFGSYANGFMPGLAKTDDKTFVGAFQAVGLLAWALYLTGKSSSQP